MSSITISKLEEEFKKIGKLRSNGVTIKNRKVGILVTIVLLLYLKKFNS